ncbi:protein dispatched homolog 1-like [Dendronephthya gigantea]|uniref:protein dispatched homolog 1-like n=1 Tax=Dendronephthya gigantea TaxID=151771 RepID=UPI00106CF973|nr:protein dispatched homolog 1-like [Dendronephthya gigantea]
MSENPALQCALSASGGSTVSTPTLLTGQKIPEDGEDEIIVESIAGSTRSLNSEGTPSPRYASFIVKHPYILLILTTVLVTLSGCFSLIPQLGAQSLPDFTDPIKGFEARGTTISDRWRSQFNLLYDEYKGKISRVPPRCQKKKPTNGHKIKDNREDNPAICYSFSHYQLTTKLAFTTKNGQNLMTAENLKSICRLEDKIIRKFYGFDDHCHKANGTKNCCPSWSVGYFIALLNGDASCLSIDETKVKTTGRLLKMCSEFYHNETLKSDCWDFMKNQKRSGRCNHVPNDCTTFNAVYNILHYLTDKNFLSSGNNVFLRYSLVLVPVKENKDFQVNIYKSRLKDGVFNDGNVEVTGYDMSQLKFEIFNERMLFDLYLAAIAMLFVMIILWLYTRSFLLTTLVGLIVVSSLVIAYFLYTKVFHMEFFPFLNIVTSVILVGIAADDAFVYIDIWNQSIREHREHGPPPSNEEQREKELIWVTNTTMKHASLSMFVTSFTTSSAFFASLTSEITSIRLFGLYSGLSILCMFLLMVTWFPAAVIIEQTVLARFSCCSIFCEKLQDTRTCRIRTVVGKLVEWHAKFFIDFLPHIVIKLRFLSLLFLVLLAAGGIFVSTVKPGLQLPSSQDFQMFHESHDLEKYSLKLKKYFYFETTKKSSFPINLIWGIKATDTGDYFNPYDMGSLKWDDNFDITSKESQRWIVSFLPRLKNRTFFAKDQDMDFMEEFLVYMSRNCTRNNKICCKASTFPYDSNIFSECIQLMQCQKLKEIQLGNQPITDGGPLFDAKSRLRAMVMKFDSTVPFTWSYDPVDRFWTETEKWAVEEFNKAPASVNGWFISELQFYDLQRSLSKGTLLSMSISLAIAFVVMMLTTGNIYISLTAIITIAGALVVTVGTIVLMGWKLNILESITLSISVGLSVDFTLHYGVAYVLAADRTNRKLRVSFSMTCMSSAISMAAFTTFIAGAIASQSRVLSYIQMGQFLMIIMSVSWVYATFFFQALCSIIGPENNSGQITLAMLKAGFLRLKARMCATEENDTNNKKSVRILYLKRRIGSVNE